MHTHPAPTLRTRHRWTRPAGALCLLSGTVALATLAPGVATAAVLGGISVSPLSGTDQTLFSGVIANAQCPVGTADSYFTIIGADIGQGNDGSGFLGQGSVTGQGRQEFNGASIANLKTANTGSFAASGAYQITFNCVSAAGITDTYETTLNYVAGGAGAFSIQAPPPPPSPPASPAASPVVSPPASPAASPVVSPPASPAASPVVSPPASPAASPVVSPPASPAASPVVSPPASPAASPVAEPSPTGIPFAGGGGGAVGGGGLPTTGVETGLVLALGTALLAAGAGLLGAGRRRSQAGLPTETP